MQGLKSLSQVQDQVAAVAEGWMVQEVLVKLLGVWKFGCTGSVVMDSLVVDEAMSVKPKNCSRSSLRDKLDGLCRADGVVAGDHRK